MSARWVLAPLVLLVSPALAEPPPSMTARVPAKVYSSTCGYCHGHNVGPIILGRHLPADYVRMMVRGGRNGMPAFRPTEISPAELAALSQWIEQAGSDAKESGQ